MGKLQIARIITDARTHSQKQLPVLPAMDSTTYHEQPDKPPAIADIITADDSTIPS